MEKHNYIGKTKEDAIQMAKEELQEVEENLLIRELESTKGGLFKSKKVEIEVIERREVVKGIKFVGLKGTSFIHLFLVRANNTKFIQEMYKE